MWRRRAAIDDKVNELWLMSVHEKRTGSNAAHRSLACWLKGLLAGVLARGEGI